MSDSVPDDTGPVDDDATLEATANRVRAALMGYPLPPDVADPAAFARKVRERATGVTVPASRSRGVTDAPPRSAWLRRHWREAATLSGVSLIGLAFLFVFLRHPGPRGSELAMASDAVVDHPESALRDPPKRITRGGEGFVLRRDDRVPFQAPRPMPPGNQWLIHIASSARLVASAGKSESISYTLQQLDANWEKGDTRYELLVQVTANTSPAGWPEHVAQPVDLGDLFTADTITNLQDIADEEDVEKRNSRWIQELRTVFDRRFGPTQYCLRAYVFKSENQ